MVGRIVYSRFRFPHTKTSFRPEKIIVSQFDPPFSSSWPRGPVRGPCSQRGARADRARPAGLGG